MKPTLSITSRQLMLREMHDYLMIALGMLFYAIGWTVFLLPNDITTGGVPGIASIVYWATGINVQYTYFAINGGLLIASLIVLGWKFSVKTIFAVLVMTTILPIIQSATSNLHLLQDQPFMACILGAIFCGSGIGFAFTANGSTGGTDIIAAIVNKYRDVSLGRMIMFCDMIIIASSYFVLHDLEKVVYGYVTLFVTGYMIDQVVNSSRQSVQFFIISSKYEEIGREINALHRGVTVIDGTGLYTGKQVKMMFVLAKKSQSNTIFQIINDIDPNGNPYDMEKVGGKDLLDVILLSATPDLYFTSLTCTQEHRHGSNYPLMNAGKAILKERKLVMPIAMTIHHGFIDGHHLSLFYKKVEEFLK